MASLRPYACVVFSLEAPREEVAVHFLDACALCRRPLGRYRDIFMYRGDTPFCTAECRQDQIDLDEAREMEASQRRRRHHRHRLAPTSVEQPTSSAPAVKAVAAGLYLSTAKKGLSTDGCRQNSNLLDCVYLSTATICLSTDVHSPSYPEFRKAGLSTAVSCLSTTV
ncbi:hypothetical protein Taro_047823 [Colocasia esculenta]|uniref:FLZ-type domain-containing protein n=1 Tax=Colocasia esculenta TaxID=4460 RepID=A0A843X1R2_COLES|nr:hypothetical protein [Colocasia esculenta]